MKSYTHHSTTTRRTIRYALCAGAFAGAAVIASGCLERPLCETKVDAQGRVLEDCRPRTTNMFVDTAPGAPVDKIDFLFMLDNSTSMSDKQQVLKAAVPDLVDRFVNPVCVGEGQNPAIAGGPDEQCPPGMKREFPPVKDIHVGIVTSSLGAQGSSLCPDKTKSVEIQEQQDDHAHLIATRNRGLAAVPGDGLAPDKLGFLDWNPKRDRTTADAFKKTFEALVPAAGDRGCGFEAQLESIYRFLSDPAPPAAVALTPCPNDPRGMCAVPSGVDHDLLAQRKAFLRPDSLVAVIMLTDENDCSIRDGSQYYLIGEGGFRGTAASSRCGTNPNDPCCYSCALGPPDGCAPDPACAAPQPARPDNLNLRCFDQKRRFGFDFLYPVERYVNALTKPTICITRDTLAGDDRQCPPQKDGKPGLVENPLFANLSGNGGPARPKENVFFAGIVGVPWQSIQQTVDDDGNPIPSGELRYKTATDMSGDGTWDRILGQPHPPGGAPPVPPTDPHMVESFTPRPGIEGPSATYMADPINGHDWAITKQNDLEYACTFKLPQTRDCNIDPENCDCGDLEPGDNNPLCQASDGSYGKTQYYAKGYPGTRELEVLRSVGDNAIVASICARNLEDPGESDYGYRPAVAAIVDRMKTKMGGKCLPRKLRREDGQYPCSILEASPNPADADCNARPGRSVPNPGLVGPALARLRDERACDDDPSTTLPDCSAMKLCAIKEAGPTCLEDTEDQPDVGWCYVDPEDGQGSETLVDPCPSNQRRILRFVDPARNTPVHGGTVLIACLGSDLSEQ